jgi:hypothetical protein
MMAADSRVADAVAVAGRDLGASAGARLDGFPSIVSPIWQPRAARRNRQRQQGSAFNHNNIENYIVNNFGTGYDSRKSADAVPLPAQGETT